MGTYYVPRRFFFVDQLKLMNVLLITFFILIRLIVTTEGTGVFTEYYSVKTLDQIDFSMYEITPPFLENR